MPMLWTLLHCANTLQSSVEGDGRYADALDVHAPFQCIGHSGGKRSAQRHPERVLAVASPASLAQWLPDLRWSSQLQPHLS